MPHLDATDWSGDTIEAQRTALAAKGAQPRVVLAWLSAAEVAEFKRAQAEEAARQSLQRECLRGGARGHAAKLSR